MASSPVCRNYRKCNLSLTNNTFTSCIYCELPVHIKCLGLTESYGTKALEHPEVYHICINCKVTVHDLIKKNKDQKMRNDTINDALNKSLNYISSTPTSTNISPFSFPSPLLPNHSPSAPDLTSNSPSAPDLSSSTLLHTPLNSTVISAPTPNFLNPKPSAPNQSNLTLLPTPTPSITKYLSPILDRIHRSPIDPVVLNNRFSILADEQQTTQEIRQNNVVRNIGNTNTHKNISIKKNTNVRNNLNNENFRINTVDFNIKIIGDSMVKYQAETLKYKTGKDVEGTCLPGAGIAEITRTLQHTNTHHSGLVTQVGTNDIGYKEEIEIKQNYRALLNTMKQCRGGAILIGILPKGGDKYGLFNDDAYYYNQWLKQECIGRGIIFLDFWRKFYNDWSMYGKDGIHASRKGKKYIVNQINEEIVSKSFLV